MSRDRKGKREREAGKRHRRGSVSFMDIDATEWKTLKLGHKKMRKHLASFSRTLARLSVAESENRQRAASTGASTVGPRAHAI